MIIDLENFTCFRFIDWLLLIKMKKWLALFRFQIYSYSLFCDLVVSSYRSFSVFDLQMPQSRACNLRLMILFLSLFFNSSSSSPKKFIRLPAINSKVFETCNK